MGFSTALIISLLLHHRVLPSGGSSLKEKVSSEEESLLEKFFAETKLFLDQADRRHVTVVGESNDQLQQTEPLLEAFPYSIENDVAIFCASRESAPDTSIVQFLTSLDRKYLINVGTKLSDCRKSRVYLIFEGSILRYDDLDWISRNAFKRTTKLPVVLHHTKRFLKIYGSVIRANCTVGNELLVDWKPRVDTKRLEDWFQLSTYGGCPLRIGTRHDPPWMNLAKDADGTMRIIGGSEGEMISAMAQKMNFTPLVQTYRLPDKVRPTDEILSSCAAGNISIGVAHIRPSAWIFQNLDVSQSYVQESMICVVPKIRKSKGNAMTFEFSWHSWLYIGMIFLVYLGVEKIVRSTRHLNRGNAVDSGCCRIVLDLIGATLGNPIVYRPISIGSKLMLIMYLCYATVTTTAYKSALSSVFTVDQEESTIAELAAFLESNITPAGSFSTQVVLGNHLERLKNGRELIKRYVVEPNGTKVLQRVSCDKNFSWVTSIYELAYQSRLLENAGVDVSFDVRNKCGPTNGNVLVLPKSSHLSGTSKLVMQRLLEAGFLDYWEGISAPSYVVIKRYFMMFGSNNFTEIPDSPTEFREGNRVKFRYIFYIYSLALAFCILVFLGELFFYWITTAGKGRRFKNLKLFKTGRRVHF